MVTHRNIIKVNNLKYNPNIYFINFLMLELNNDFSDIPLYVNWEKEGAL